MRRDILASHCETNSFYFLCLLLYPKGAMQKTSQQQFYIITVELSSGKTKEVPVMAASLEVAERRALKKTQNGVKIKRAFTN